MEAERNAPSRPEPADPLLGHDGIEGDIGRLHRNLIDLLCRIGEADCRRLARLSQQSDLTLFEYYLTDKDALLVVSSSGNSPNVVNACEYANAKGVPTIAFVGFRGGRLKEIATHVVHVDVQNYGIVEDIHMSLIHVLTQYMTARG